MISSFVVFWAAIPYAIGFCLLAFLPGWRSLAFISFGAISLGLWAFNDVAQGDSPGVLLALPVMLFGLLGLFAGFVARTTVLLGYDMSWRATHPGLVLPIVFVGVLGCFLAWSALEQRWGQMRRAPPSAACLERMHVAKLGDVTLAIPLVPAIRVGLGWEHEPSYLFEINQHARDFCELASPSPPALTNISFDLTRLQRIGSSQRLRELCARPRPLAWWSATCEREKDASGDYPEDLTVYVLGEYNARRMQAKSADSAADFRKRMAGLSEKPMDDGVTRYGSEREIYFTRASSPAYVARCHTTTPGTTGYDLYCSTGYQLSPGLGMIYDFRASEKGFERRSAEVDRMAREIFDSLKAP